ncbi:MAG: hypothetical protein NZM12_00145 [Steroidobacteraceae bacterium]|nr:hypothetical protein [Steroidobacteraceae bacterium]MDW8258339.1 DUF6763 family protein [Gammaproteobacteria bacterium]
MHAPYPQIGSWYRFQGGEQFEVVALDEDDRTVDVQYFDGTVEELDLDDWLAQADARLIEETEPPEDVSGSLDMDFEDENAPADYDRSIDAASWSISTDWDNSTY